jgi:transcriptional regulator with XRE-family HTH domain
VQVNTSGYGPVVSRALLANAIKQLRQASGQQQNKVTDALEWSVSKLILIENGSVHVTGADLEALLRYYKTTDRERTAELTAWAEGARLPGWWDRFRIQDKAFERYVGYESGATSIRMAQGLLIPGLLQTEGYARLVAGVHAGPEEVDSTVLLRLQRQQEVFSRAPDQLYILDEAVLRRQVGDTMPGQLRHLLEVARRPEVMIRIVPFWVGPHFGFRGPFVLLGFTRLLGRVLYLESARSRQYNLLISEEGVISNHGIVVGEGAAEEIARYEDGFEALARLALGRAESISLLEQIASEIV